MVRDSRKQEGAHYTPKALADFVAKQICNSAANLQNETLNILEPSAGEGELLESLVREIRKTSTAALSVSAFDTDANALLNAKKRISQLEYNALSINWQNQDFLDYVTNENELSLFPMFTTGTESKLYDIVIANPPYVRTNVMGQKKSQKLAAAFNLEGRVDLYYAFLLAINRMLKPGGTAGVIVSNRFLTTLSGAAIRKAMLEQYEILHVWDLGDTKLFEAAVLPAVLLLKKIDKERLNNVTLFTSVYASTACEDDKQPRDISILDCLGNEGKVNILGSGTFEIKTGKLDIGKHNGDVWRVSNDESDEWLNCVKRHTSLVFSDIGKIRVGVKTTADNVFIRTDWDSMPEAEKPELLFPLITHHEANQFKAIESKLKRQILYTHVIDNGKRKPVKLANYPKSQRYLESHRAQLEGRAYVREAGREWFEIWVSHNPDDFKKQKIVFRDISVKPTFWLDNSGAIVNGDCYWIINERNADSNLLWLALGVANSRFIEDYYDKRFNNKLYAGRRRFMTQYVEQFPLPLLDSEEAVRIIKLTQEIYKKELTPELERALNDSVYQSFGLFNKEIGR